jgi:hypothetical protein
MGVLDDAIRQHLELKRKHGAPEEELQRQEEEALGPARREVTAVEEAEPAGGDGELPDHAAPEAAEAQVTDLAAAEAEVTEPEVVEPEAVQPDALEQEAVAEPPVAAPAEDAVAADEEEADEIPPDEEDAAFESEPAEPGLRSGETPVHGFPALEGDDVEEPEADAEHAQAERQEDEEPEGDADVLEETPDFLEETPEHDRLWFEQKPPRDFDFD